MARDPLQGSSGSAPERERPPAQATRQRSFGEAGNDDGWTLIGPDEETAPEPIEDGPESEPEAERASQPESDPEPGFEPQIETEHEHDHERERESETAATADELSADPFAVAVEDPATAPQPTAESAAAPPALPAPPRESWPRESKPPVRAAPARRSALPTSVAALALLALAALAWRYSSVVRALEADLAAERARAAAPIAASSAADQELARLRAEAERLERELDDVTRRAAAAESASGREGEALERATTLGAERDGLSGELAAAQRALEEAEARARTSEARLDTLGSELERARQVAPAGAIGPDERRAEACDRVLGRIEAGQGAAARTQLDAGLAAGLFARGARDGAEFLGELADAAGALERARVERATSTAPAAAAALSAREHLAGARERLPEFARDAAEWLERDVRGGPAAEAGARAARVERALSALEAESASLGAEVDDLHGADWTWLASRGPAQDPELARAHAQAFGCGHLSELASAAAEHLREDCFADGAPLPERLLAADCLPTWTAILGAQASRSEAELELLWLEAARRWYAAGAPAADFEWHGLEAPPIVERARDWRAELWLRVRLAAPDSAWPPRPGEVALYRLSGPSRARWRSDRRVDEGAGAGWTWLRTHYDEHGATLGEPALVEVELVGERARLSGAELVLLDLRVPQPGCEVAPAPVPTILPPPAATGFREREVLGLAAEATRSTCLVVRQGDTTRWFSPRLGLVLEQRELASGTSIVELALREAAP